MLNLVIAIVVLLALLLGSISVQRAYHRFARRNPQAGPFRVEGQSCASCAQAATCERKPEPR